MSFYFLDTSALIKHYVDEVGSSWLEATVFKPAGNMLLVSRITVVEMRSALARRKREASIKAERWQLCGKVAIFSAVASDVSKVGNFSAKLPIRWQNHTLRR